MITDPDLLQQAVDDLIRLKPRAADPARDLIRLYPAALADWADRLGISPADLNRLVLMREAVPGGLWRQALQAVNDWARALVESKNRSGAS